MELQTTKQISIDVSKHKYISLDAKQYDRNLRFILITCYRDGTLLPINKNTCFASIRYRKPDGYGVFNSCEITNDGKILVELTEQMLAVSGTCYADVVIHENVNLSVEINEIKDDDGNIETVEIKDNGNSGIISTMTFVVHVFETAVNNIEIESSYEYNALNNALIENRRDYNEVINTSRSYMNTTEGYMDKTEGYMNATDGYMNTTEGYMNNTEDCKNMAISYAVGGTGTRDGEDNDNAEWYAEKAREYSNNSYNSKEEAFGWADGAMKSAQAALANEEASLGYAVAAQSSMNSAIDSASSASKSATDAYNYYLQTEAITNSLNGAFLPMGTIEYTELATLVENNAVAAGYLYNISDNFVTNDTFKEGAGVEYVAGTNVYYTSDGYWDCLAGTTVTGVKGSNEPVYRKGNIDISAVNVGAIASSDVATVDDVTYWLGIGNDNTVNGMAIKAKYPTLSDYQKKQMQDLIDQYMRVRNTLFYYTGAARRECYAYTGSGEYTKYAYDTPEYPVLQHINENVDSGNPDKEYFKYMLNCGLFCQMVWMGRPISDFLSGETDEEKLLLDYAEGKVINTSGNIQSSPRITTLTSCPTVTTEINSTFVDASGKPWGYYFDFILSKKAFNARNSTGNLYSYNSYFDYDNTPINIEISAVTTNDYSSRKEATGQAKAYSLTNQVLINSQFVLDVKNTISAGTKIHLGTITKYLPSYKIPLTVFHSSKMFAGYIDNDNNGTDEDDGKIFVYCNEELEGGKTYYITVNTTYIPYNEVESNGTVYPLGFDGVSSMAEELHALGCEVPYSQIDIGDLVFFRITDLSDDFRNKSNNSDDDALANRSFRHITHVGIVYDIDKYGYPVIADCTDSYSDPIILSKTTITSSDIFGATKAAHERNNVVMVARHPAVFGFGGNVPEEFTAYRGSLVGKEWVQ